MVFLLLRCSTLCLDCIFTLLHKAIDCAFTVIDLKARLGLLRLLLSLALRYLRLGLDDLVRKAHALRLFWFADCLRLQQPRRRLTFQFVVLLGDCLLQLILFARTLFRSVLLTGLCCSSFESATLRFTVIELVTVRSFYNERSMLSDRLGAFDWFNVKLFVVIWGIKPCLQFNDARLE